MLHADGKVIAPLFKAKPGDQRLDRTTGETAPHPRTSPMRRCISKATAKRRGAPSSSSSPRGPTSVHGRIILDVEWVPTPGGEARSRRRLLHPPRTPVPGAQGVIYDTALRGVHHQHLLRELGLLPINRVTAAKAGAKKPARGNERRVEKNVHIEDKTITLADGTATHRSTLRARWRARHRRAHRHRRPHASCALARIRTHRNADKDGSYRWYNDYQLPAAYGHRTLTVRLHGNDEDAARKFNRTENVRPIPPGDPDFERLFPRRNDAESINRHLDDTMWLGRAHSIGHARQHLNLLGFALTVNSLALHRHRRHRAAATRRLTLEHRPARRTERAPQPPWASSISPRRRRHAPKHVSRPRSPLTWAAWRTRFSPTNRAGPAPVAQGIERRFPKPCVAGSNPAGGATKVQVRQYGLRASSPHPRPKSAKSPRKRWSKARSSASRGSTTILRLDCSRRLLRPRYKCFQRLLGGRRLRFFHPVPPTLRQGVLSTNFVQPIRGASACAAPRPPVLDDIPSMGMPQSRHIGRDDARRPVATKEHRRFPLGWTAPEVSTLTGVPTRTLQVWRKDGFFVPGAPCGINRLRAGRAVRPR